MTSWRKIECLSTQFRERDARGELIAVGPLQTHRMSENDPATVDLTDCKMLREGCHPGGCDLRRGHRELRAPALDDAAVRQLVLLP